MHSYSVDKEVRKRIAIIIFIISMVISLLVQGFCSDIIKILVEIIEKSRFSNIANLLVWLEVNPSIFNVPFWYGILTWIYEKWVWKINWLSKLHGIPDFSGEWDGTLTSSFNGQTIPMKLTIEQTWSAISITTKFPKTNSISNSNVAAIHVEGNKGTRLYFAYSNESYDVNHKMQEHNGYNILTLMPDNEEIIGRYFNDRENPNPKIKGGNKGTFSLKKNNK